MNRLNRFIAEVPSNLRSQEIRWLILEQDAGLTGGWYLYMHRDLDEASKFDSWHLTREEAEREAAIRWGVTIQDWKLDA